MATFIDGICERNSNKRDDKTLYRALLDANLGQKRRNILINEEQAHNWDGCERCRCNHPLKNERKEEEDDDDDDENERTQKLLQVQCRKVAELPWVRATTVSTSSVAHTPRAPTSCTWGLEHRARK